MKIEQLLLQGKAQLSVTGLGYVGLPLAVAFAGRVPVVGYDADGEKVDAYRRGEDPTGSVGAAAVQASGIRFTANADDLRGALFHIIAVPTPVHPDKRPDLSAVAQASRQVGRQLQKGAVVVYESTVYPGVTEEVCIPLLEGASGLVCGRDFSVGYSPERINPGDRAHPLEEIVKIVSGMDEPTLETVAQVYGLVIRAGVYRAGSIRVAEAAKVAENSQRDLNIAFVNELAMVFDRMGIDTREVLDAMATKWNALPFVPGLVGGHCIGVDPYYFLYQAQLLGYQSQLLAAGRKINDGMAAFVADQAIRQLILAGGRVCGSRVGILGVTFKEDCPDIRNSRVVDMVARLREFGIEPVVADPWADAQAVWRCYGLRLVPLGQLRGLDCLVLAVAHRQLACLTPEQVAPWFASGADCPRIVMDVKSRLDRQAYLRAGFRFWRL